jgi:hydrogenase maturation protease
MKSLLIGVGNEYRGDDGVGLIVARRLREKSLKEVAVMEASGEGVSLIEAWKAALTVILADAVCSGAEAGTIHRFEAHNQPLPAKFFRYSTHAFGVAEAIELARALNQLPPHLIVYGIEGRNFAAGVGLSPEVNEAAQRVVGCALQDLAHKFGAAPKKENNPR